MPVVPSWFKGRQGKAEEVNPQLLKVTGPNLNEWHIGIRRREDGRWAAFLRKTAEGPDAAEAEVSSTAPEYEAWEAAFELYRNVVII